MNTHKNIVILEKAVRHAVDNGWDMFGELPFKFKGGGSWAIADKGDFNHTPLLVVKGEGESEAYRAFYELEQIIFNHGFCIALWPDFGDNGSGQRNLPDTWKHNIKEMALAYDRLKYLGENT